MYKVSSEIYKETNFQPVSGDDGKVVSKFKFHYPSDDDSDHDAETQITKAAVVDKDGDLLVVRRKSHAGHIEIEHSEATELRLVGLQVWRGALLLADFLFHHRAQFRDKQILELGAGVGLTSIAAATFARRVICTDVDIGGLLELIRANVRRNNAKAVQVMEFDFMQRPQDYAPALLQAIDASEVVVAADVIYDDMLTDAFVHVLDAIFARERDSNVAAPKSVYVALEKRYVFTLSELDAVAPMFEHFLRQTRHKSWHIEYLRIDELPQYFEYERCPQLVLLHITSGRGHGGQQ